MTANDKLHLEAVQLLRDYKRVSGKAKDYNADRKAKTAKLGELLSKGCDALDRGELIGGIATRGEWYAQLSSTSGYPLKRRWAEKLIERHRNADKKNTPSGRIVTVTPGMTLRLGKTTFTLISVGDTTAPPDYEDEHGVHFMEKEIAGSDANVQLNLKVVATKKTQKERLAEAQQYKHGVDPATAGDKALTLCGLPAKSLDTGYHKNANCPECLERNDYADHKGAEVVKQGMARFKGKAAASQ